MRQDASILGRQHAVELFLNQFTGHGGVCKHCFNLYFFHFSCKIGTKISSSNHEFAKIIAFWKDEFYV